MGLAILAACAIAAAFSAFGAKASPVDGTDIEAVVVGNNSFAFDLYRELAREEGNLFLSPYSISSALAMTYAGAHGETANQMAATLHFDVTQERLHPAFSSLTEMLTDTGKNYQLVVANALWGQTGYKFLPEFLGVVSKYYGAGLSEVDYVDDANREQARQTINQWVESKTNGKIKELIQSGDLSPLTRLVLTNAIWFKGKWELEFKPESTKIMEFHVTAQKTVDVPMMHQIARLNYAENDEVQILELPYAGGDLAMVIVLPRPDYELAKVDGMLGLETVRSWLSQLSSKEVEVLLPRFKLEKGFLLNEKLQDLGMVDAFDESAADFSGMTPGRDLYISSVIHQAFVEVNEEGTEAAAATAVIMGGKSAGLNKRPIFRADRPFVFMIWDRRSAAILFLGRLVDPRS